MEATTEEQVRVVLTALEDESEEGKARFAQDLASTFHIAEQKAWEILAARPYTIRKSCPPGVASRIEHTICRLGGLCRVEPVGAPMKPESIATATPPEAAPPTSPGVAPPAPPPPAADAWGAEDVGGLGASIPLAAPAPPSPDGAAAPIVPGRPVSGTPSGDTVACKECGSVEPVGGKSCSQCHFPLPAVRKGPVGHAPSVRERSCAGAPSTSTPTGYGELAQAAPAVITASILLFLNAGVNLWSLAFITGVAARSMIVSSLIDVALAFGLLKGNSKARIWVLVRAGLGMVIWGGFSLMTGDPFTAVIQVIYSVSLILLLTGKGSLLKAILVGVPNGAGMGLALVGLLFMSASGALVGVDMGEISNGLTLMEEGDYDSAMRVFRGVIRDTPREGNNEVLAALYYNLGICYLEKGDPVRAIPELQASVALNDQDPDAHYLLGVAYMQSGQLEQSLEHLDRTWALDADYADLEETLEQVRNGLRRSSY